MGVNMKAFSIGGGVKQKTIPPEQTNNKKMPAHLYAGYFLASISYIQRH